MNSKLGVTEISIQRAGPRGKRVTFGRRCRRKIGKPFRTLDAFRCFVGRKQFVRERLGVDPTLHGVHGLATLEDLVDWIAAPNRARLRKRLRRAFPIDAAKHFECAEFARKSGPAQI